MFLHDERFTGFKRGERAGSRYRVTDDEKRAEGVAGRAARDLFGKTAFAEIERCLNRGGIYPGARLVGVMVPKKTRHANGRTTVMETRLVHGVGDTFAEAFADAEERACRPALFAPR